MFLLQKMETARVELLSGVWHTVMDGEMFLYTVLGWFLIACVVLFGVYFVGYVVSLLICGEFVCVEHDWWGVLEGIL